jgi:hypothetical protein
MNITSKTKREELVAKIEPLLQQVETWRKTRTGQEKMPEPLWAAAVELAKTYGISSVQGKLRIDYGGLRRRTLGPGSVPPSKKPTASAGFVELPVINPVRRSEHTVELEDGAGRKMTIKASGGNLAELLPLAQAFWVAAV